MKIQIFLSFILIIAASFIVSGCVSQEDSMQTKSVISINSTAIDKPSEIKVHVEAVSSSASSNNCEKPPVKQPDKKPVPSSVSPDSKIFI